MFDMQKKESLENVFHNENILKFTDINVYLTSIFMFRYYHGDGSDVFQNFFVLNSDVHEHYIRQSGYNHVPCAKNNSGKWCIRYRCVIVWNSILNLKINPETFEAVFVKTI